MIIYIQKCEYLRNRKTNITKSDTVKEVSGVYAGKISDFLCILICTVVQINVPFIFLVSYLSLHFQVAPEIEIEHLILMFLNASEK